MLTAPATGWAAETAALNVDDLRGSQAGKGLDGVYKTIASVLSPQSQQC